MSERKFDCSKITDFEISLLIVERDCAYYRQERLDGLLATIGQAKDMQDAEKRESATDKTSQIPHSVDVKSLPWKSYKTKVTAAIDEAGWIFANTVGAEALAATLKAKEKAQIGIFEFSFSGKNKEFISRKPLKKTT